MKKSSAIETFGMIVNNSMTINSFEMLRRMVSRGFLSRFCNLALDFSERACKGIEG